VTNKFLSYIIFIIALVVGGVFIYMNINTPPPKIKEGSLQKIKQSSKKELNSTSKIGKSSTNESSLNRFISLKMVKIDSDNNETNETNSTKNKKIGESDSDVIIAKKFIKGEQNLSYQDQNITKQKDEEPQEDKKNLQNSSKNDPDNIMGVDPVPMKLHTLDENFTDINIDKPTDEDKPLSQYLEEANSELGNPVLIRIFKSSSILEIWIKNDEKFKHLKSYPICKYSGDLGPKLLEGDGQSPEGFYSITKSSLNPNSKFHLSMNIGYPNKYDKAHRRTGSYIMIHGACVSIGCFAMGDKPIEEIYEIVETALNSGQKSIQVQIFPFRMTAKEMIKHSNNVWYDFWLNLKEGYDFFEANRVPPKVGVVDGNYTFSRDKKSLTIFERRKAH